MRFAGRWGYQMDQKITECEDIRGLEEVATILQNLELDKSLLWWSLGVRLRQLNPPDMPLTSEYLALISRLQYIPAIRHLTYLETEGVLEEPAKLSLDHLCYIHVGLEAQQCGKNGQS